MATVESILRRKGSDVWHVTPDALVYDALQILAEKNVGFLAVLSGNELVGVFSERDYARKVVLLGKSSRTMPVRDVMVREMVVVPPDEKVDVCMKLMTEKRVRHLPVMEGDKLVGIISMGDVVKQIISDQKTTIGHLEKYIRGV